MKPLTTLAAFAALILSLCSCANEAPIGSEKDATKLEPAGANATTGDSMGLDTPPVGSTGPKRFEAPEVHTGKPKPKPKPKPR